MVLASQFAPIRGIWPGFCASARRSNRGAVDQPAIPIDLVGCLEFRKQIFKDVLPDTRFLPLPKITPAGLSAGKVAGRRKPSPRDARAENQENMICFGPGRRFIKGQRFALLSRWRNLAFPGRKALKLNNKFRAIQRRAYGFRDEEYLRLKIVTCMLPKL